MFSLIYTRVYIVHDWRTFCLYASTSIEQKVNERPERTRGIYIHIHRSAPAVAPIKAYIANVMHFERHRARHICM